MEFSKKKTHLQAAQAQKVGNAPSNRMLKNAVRGAENAEKMLAKNTASVAVRLCF